jgi:hypothetical protein
MNRLRRRVRIKAKAPESFHIIVEKGNPSRIDRCQLCLLNNKRFTIDPPMQWRRSITWHYPKSLFLAFLELLKIHRRVGTILNQLPKDLLLHLFQYVARSYIQDSKPQYRNQCDDCTYYYREITGHRLDKAVLRRG